MKKLTVFGIAAGMALVSMVGAASAEPNAARENYYASGTHQFYVWCTGGVPSYTATADGASAEEAQMKAYEESKAKGKCWPLWQGKV